MPEKVSRMNSRVRFHDQIHRLFHCEDVPLDTQEQVLAALCELACTIELTEEECKPVPAGYAARLLYSDPAGWSLALVVLQPGQETPPHDHVSWGCAATVQGIERNRWFAGTCPDALHLLGQHEVPPGRDTCSQGRQFTRRWAPIPRERPSRSTFSCAAFMVRSSIVEKMALPRRGHRASPRKPFWVGHPGE